MKAEKLEWGEGGLHEDILIPCIGGDGDVPVNLSSLILILERFGKR